MSRAKELIDPLLLKEEAERMLWERCREDVEGDPVFKKIKKLDLPGRFTRHEGVGGFYWYYVD